VHTWPASLLKRLNFHSNPSSETDAYFQHKAKRFPVADEKEISRNEAFLLTESSVRESYKAAYASTSALYYKGQPPFEDLLTRIQANAARL
jgi:hypothetical protein